MVRPGDPRRFGLPHVYVCPTRLSDDKQRFTPIEGVCEACGCPKNDEIHRLTLTYGDAARAAGRRNGRPYSNRARRQLRRQRRDRDGAA